MTILHLPFIPQWMEEILHQLVTITTKHCKWWDYNGINHLSTGPGFLPSWFLFYLCPKRRDAPCPGDAGWAPSLLWRLADACWWDSAIIRGFANDFFSIIGVPCDFWHFYNLDRDNHENEPCDVGLSAISRDALGCHFNGSFYRLWWAIVDEWIYFEPWAVVDEKPRYLDLIWSITCFLSVIGMYVIIYIYILIYHLVI